MIFNSLHACLLVTRRPYSLHGEAIRYTETFISYTETSIRYVSVNSNSV